MKAFLHTRLIADRTASKVKPDSVFRHHPYRVDDKRRIVHPFADRVPVKTLLSNLLPYTYCSIRQFGEFPAVGPNDAPGFRILIQNRHFVFVLENLSISQIVEVCSWEAQRLALVPRVVVRGGINLISPDRRLVRLVSFQSV